MRIVWDRRRRALRRGIPRRAAPNGDCPPGTSQDAQVLACSGFIANRRELQADAGLSPTSSDREIAAALYARCGLDAPSRIAGPFSWLLWDAAERRLVAVRDRLGVEGLYFEERGDEVHYALRPPSLAGGTNGAPLDGASLSAYLCGRSASPGATVYRAVRQVEPGYLRVESSTARESRYWAVEPRPLWRAASDGEYAEGLWQLLGTVVGEHLSAPPVGITLSAGLDSTAVAAAARQRLAPDELVPLCWSAPELPEADETALAGAVCQRLRLEPRMIRADRLWPLSDDREPRGTALGPARVFFPEVWRATLQAAAARGVTSLLTGASGDHLFGGNVFSYPDLLLTLRWKRLAGELRRHLRRSSSGLARIVRTMILGPIWRHAVGRSPLAPPPAWLGPRARAELPPEPERERRMILPGRGQLLEQLGERYLLSILDELREWGLEHGVTLRHPLLDHRLFELAASLPTSQVFRAADRKIILRHAMAGRLPDEVVRFRGKIVPVTLFHRGARERGRSRVLALLESMRAAEAGWVDPRGLRRSYEDYLAGSSNAGFWRGIALEAWLRGRDD